MRIRSFCINPGKTELCSRKLCRSSQLVQVSLQCAENAWKVLLEVELVRRRLRVHRTAKADDEKNCDRYSTITIHETSMNDGEPKQIEFAAATAKSQLKLSGQIIIRFSREHYDNDCCGRWSSLVVRLSFTPWR